MRPLVLLSLLAFLLPAAAQAQTTPGAPDPNQPRAKPMTPPENKMPERLTCVFDRAWRCRHNGCTLDGGRPVNVDVNLKTGDVCMLRGGECRQRMKFQVIRRNKREAVGILGRRRMVVAIRSRRAVVTEIRSSRVYVVWGRCRPVSDQ